MFCFSGYGQTVTISDVSGAEDDGAITVSATLDIGVPGGFSVEVSSADGSATVLDSDYTAVVSQVLAFAGTAGETQQFTVTPTFDNKLEIDENLTVSMSNLLGTLTLVNISDTAIITINNDDSAAVSIDNVSAAEGAGLLFTVTLNNAVSGGFTVTTGYADISATGGALPLASPEDYNNGAQVLNFTGTAGETQQFAVATFNDTFVEGPETLTVDLTSSNASVTDSDTATGTITDNDFGNITIEDVTETEGDQIRFRVTNNVLVPNPFTVTVNFLDVTATGGDIDYDSAQQTLSFNGSVDQGRNVDVDTNNDNLVEGPETFTVTLTSNDPVVDDSDTATGTINDDDVFRASVTATDDTATEANPVTDTGTFTVSLDEVNNTGSPIAINYSVSGSSTAVSGADYTGLSGSVQIANGQRTNTILVTPINDNIVENTETVVVELTAGISYDLGNLDSRSATLSINDTDTFTATVVATNATADENPGSNGTFTVDLGSVNNTGANVIVNYGITGNATAGNDYTPLSGTVAISNGQRANTITVIPINDTAIENDETVILSLAPGVRYTVGPPNNATVTIVSDDTATISVNDLAPVNEGNSGTSTLNFTVSIDASDAANDITVNYLISGGNEDGISSTLTFLAGTSTFSQQVSVTTNGDDAVEADEDISVTLSNPSANATISLTDNIGTSSFTDDDSAGLVINDIVVNEEDGTATFTITLNGNTFLGTRVDYQTSDDTATSEEDYSTTSSFVDFGSGSNQTRTISIPILDDSLLESDETFFVNLTSSSSPFITIVDNQGIAIIEDDDNCGFEAPIIDELTPTTFCDVIDVSLNDYIITPPPTGTVLIWSINSNPFDTPAYLSAAQVANPPRDGSYYGFFYDDNGTPGDSNDDCASSVIVIELTLNTSPSLTSFADGERCGPGTVTLTAQGSGAASLVWYAAADSDDPLFTGENFITPVISSTTSFYVEALENNCTSERQEVIALVGEASTTGTATNGAACNITTNGPTLIDLDDRLTGATAGVWSVTTDLSNSITINSDNEIDFAGRISGDYVFTFTTTAFTAPCTEETVDVTISVSDCNTDDDLDGLVTGQEVVLGTNPNNPDTDGDGIEDGVEAGTDLNNPLDEDDDGIIDALDSNILDTDGDGVNDQQDPANENPCIPDNSSADCPVDLEITKTADTLAALIGDTVTFTITVTNLTDKITEVAKVGDLLENGFEYVSQSASNGTYDEVTGEWDIENLPALGTATLDIVVTLVAGDSYTNTAQLLESTPVDDNASNDVSEPVVIETTIVEGVDLLIEKRAIPSTVLIGDNVVFELKVTNESVSDIVTNIRISDVLDVNFEFVSAETDFGTFDELNGEWLIPQLELGEEAVLLITARAPRLGIFENTASYISSSPRDGDAANNSETVRVEVIEKTEASPGFLYNQFSPNGNGQNEVLRINLEDAQTGIDVSILYSISIFDRYGNQVFEEQNANSGDVWDGTYEGKEAPEGTYFYVLKYSINNGDEVTAKGWIQLIR